MNYTVYLFGTPSPHHIDACNDYGLNRHTEYEAGTIGENDLAAFMDDFFGCNIIIKARTIKVEM